MSATATIAKAHISAGIAALELSTLMTLLGIAAPVAETTKMTETPPAETTATKNIITESSKFTHSPKRGDQFHCIGRRKK